MKTKLVEWAPAVAAVSRIEHCHKLLQGKTFFEQIQIFNKIVGADYIFRLNDLVGTETIRTNRPSWANFYIDDIYGLHIPLDPRAPETEKFLGKKVATKEFAFYAGMGFDGYQLALNTKRIINKECCSIEFGDYNLDWLGSNILQKERVFEADGSISKETYYRIYGEAILALFDAYSELNDITDKEEISEDHWENVAGASLLFLCGGHRGCSQHISPAERTETQLAAILIALYAKSLVKREQLLVNSQLRKSSNVVGLHRIQA